MNSKDKVLTAKFQIHKNRLRSDQSPGHCAGGSI